MMGEASSIGCPRAFRWPIEKSLKRESIVFGKIFRVDVGIRSMVASGNNTPWTLDTGLCVRAQRSPNKDGRHARDASHSPATAPTRPQPPRTDRGSLTGRCQRVRIGRLTGQPIGVE